ncbi:DegT/DnrJ/EryC1/StrS family aminotransferase [Fundidesulfovibrio magnetotacticus]|nr:DegT/DnrJ/EryC1/StrS family aminotransferase [Fundidesulfovibrio magnetotacticus]
MGEEEKEALARVIDSGILSRYLGCWHEDFYGGPEVQALEREWAARFGVKHAIAVNSCTSGLYAAVGAVGTEPGDEIIVPPYTMAATTTAPLVYGAIPVFADVEPDCFCIDPAAVEAAITPRTRAIMAVDLFGLPYNALAINAIARKHGIRVIEDNAQAPGALHFGREAGSLADIGVFSLNYHKHIHTGEGGMVVTNDDELADKVRLIRNHAEAVVEAKGTTDLVNMVGFNYRLTELQAAVGRCQLAKFDTLLAARQENSTYLSSRLAEIDCITPPKVREGCTHVYYVHACLYDAECAGLPRQRFLEAVSAELAPTELREGEGVLLSGGYVRPLYLQPIFQRRIAFGSQGFPFVNPWNPASPRYDAGLCPTCERLHTAELIEHELMRPPMTRADLDDVADAFTKVWELRHTL